MSQHDQLAQLEGDMQRIEWDELSLEPDPAEVREIDEELPIEWTSIDYEQAFYDEVEEPTVNLSDAMLNERLYIPEGDIDENARQAIGMLDIDTVALTEEIQLHSPYSPNQSENYSSFQNQGETDPLHLNSGSHLFEYDR